VNVSVVGLGKIGLPLAVQYALKGQRVFGIDINASVVSQVNKGIEPFPGEAHLDTLLPQVVDSGLLTATDDYAEAIPQSDVVVVVVPLFVDSNAKPDFGWMDSATESIAQHLRASTIVIYETTLPVGTTRNRWAPMLEKTSGLVEGKDFDVVFSPERVLTGRVFADLKKYPKLVGGLSDAGRDRAIAFYEQVLDFDVRGDLQRPNGVWPLDSAEAAEFVKLAETTYRDVNIGLANQFARYADTIGVNFYDIIEAANSQPYSHIHRPGIAVGGHCIPVYPRLYLWNDPKATVVEAARQANLEMPSYTVHLLEETVGGLSGLTVLLLGVSYRGGVKETAFSGAFDVTKELVSRGARVVASDPMYSDDELAALGFTPLTDLDSVDAIIVQADHREFLDLSDHDFPALRAIIDGRGFVSSEKWGGKLQVLGKASI
jgi:nucleotide sugar dehydrogenase